MGLIEDHRSVIRQHRAVHSIAQIQIGKEEMMIYDNDIRLLSAIPHAGNEARVKLGTLLAQATLRACVDVTPERKPLRQTRKLSSITNLCIPGPLTDFIEIVDFLQTFEYWRSFRTTKPIQTEIVVAPFHVGCAEGFRQNALE